MSSALCNDPATYAPVLQRAVELLGKTNAGLSFGTALEQASAELQIAVPSYMEEPLLMVLFKIFTEGRLPGCPDA